MSRCINVLVSTQLPIRHHKHNLPTQHRSGSSYALPCATRQLHILYKPVKILYYGTP